MWIVGNCLESNTELIKSYSEDGYEPFCVTPDLSSNRIWFKKKVKKEVKNGNREIPN